MTSATATSEILRPPLVEGGKTYGQITDDICAPMEKTPAVGVVFGFRSIGRGSFVGRHHGHRSYLDRGRNLGS